MNQTKYQKWQCTQGAWPALAILWCCGLWLVGSLVPTYLWAQEANVGPLLVHIVDPTSSTMILPGTFPLPGERKSTINVSACRGELESASFIIRPLLRDINDLRIYVTDLKGTSGIIPSRNIDLRIVKAWFQGGSAWSTIRASQTAILVPELLLHDDGLIKVDTKSKMNY